MSGPHGIGVIYEYLTEEFGKYRSNYVLNWNNIVTMQYTGYDGEDKVKIFDRDVVEAGDPDKRFLSTIVWSPTKGGWGAKQGKQTIFWSRDVFTWSLGCETWKVVGNAFENPELVDRRSNES